MSGPDFDADLQLAKAELVTWIQRVLNDERLSTERAAARLQVPTSSLRALFQQPLTASSLEALLRILTGLGNGVEVVIRPQRDRKGYLRVLQVLSVDDRD